MIPDGEPLTSKAKRATKATASVSANIDLGLDPALGDSSKWTIEVWKSGAPFKQKWRFRIRAGNGRIICPPEPMFNKSDVLTIARKLAPGAKEVVRD